MSGRLYFDLRESLKLKKIIERLEDFLFHEDLSALNFSISRNHLKELSAALSPVSMTRILLEELFGILEKTPLHQGNGRRGVELIEELKKKYQLDALQFKKMAAPVRLEEK